METSENTPRVRESSTTQSSESETIRARARSLLRTVDHDEQVGKLDNQHDLKELSNKAVVIRQKMK